MAVSNLGGIGTLPTLDFFVAGVEAWFPDENEGWVSGTLKTRTQDGDTVKLVFTQEGSSKEIIHTGKASDLSTFPPLRNPRFLEATDDLTELSHLNEPAVLNNVKLRFQRQVIYTYSGIVLIALNPFKNVPLYTDEVMAAYCGKRREDQDPHLFAVADEAYQTLKKGGKNQTIVCSGESGAGKTVSAKFIMRYFANVENLLAEGGSFGANKHGMSEVEKAVLATNPIAEAFGNAKTTRNDNSSRFGKYTEIQLSPTGENGGLRISGAAIRTYLLERSRIVIQPATERGYHIFYQLCAGCPPSEKKGLGLLTWDKFRFISQGGEGTIPGVNDAAEFEETQKALSTIGIPINRQWDLFKICAAVLHLGNMDITENRSGEADIKESDEHFNWVVKLLEVDKKLFRQWIIKKEIRARTETVVTTVNAAQASVSRDSIAKYLYSALFDWIILMINANLAKGGDSDVKRPFIGVLDIYGFEFFKRNSFEQFCINFANEKLQQEFNEHVFKLEQEEYVKEKITWSFIDFNDNQPCIDLIEGKLGIMDFLDEESRLPSGTDNGLITKLYQKFAGAAPKDKHPFFEKPRFGTKAFVVRHYAVSVTYDIEGFLEKNKDTVTEEQLSVLKASSSSFALEVLSAVGADSSSGSNNDLSSAKSLSRGSVSQGAAQKRSPTLGAIFRASLVDLMKTIRSTDAHYIRCIKSNQTKTPFGFEPVMVLSQLRACGVLETIRISSAGYPSRRTFDEFADRYYLLLRSKDWTWDNLRIMTTKIVEKIVDNKDKYQVGLTKVFFRTGVIAKLEMLRTDRYKEAGLLLQKNLRRVRAQNNYRRLKKATIMLQRMSRGMLARKLALSMRRTNAATQIQRHVRGYLERTRYQKQRKAAITLQSGWRARKARLELRSLRENAAATKIQKIWRGFEDRKAYDKKLRMLTLVQATIRRHAAKRELRKLKLEARSVTMFKEKANLLEKKVFELSQKLKDRDDAKAEYTTQFSHLEAQVKTWKERASTAEVRAKELAENTVAKQAMAEKDKLLQEKTQEMEELKKRMQSQLAEQQRENAVLVDEGKKKDARLTEIEAEVTKLRSQGVKRTTQDKDMIEQLQAEVLKLNERISDFQSRSPEVSSYNITSRKARKQPSVPDAATGLRPPRPEPIDVARAAALSDIQNGNDELLSPKQRSGNGLAHLYADGRRTSMINLHGNGENGYADDDHEEEYEEETLPDEVARAKEILSDDRLVNEIVDRLVRNLTIPTPTEKTLNRGEIFFGAHLIGVVVDDMLDHNLVQRVYRLMNAVMSGIQMVTSKPADDYVPCFWLSNTYELWSILAHIRGLYESRRDQYQPGQNMNDTAEAEGILSKIVEDMGHLLVAIIHSWLESMKKRLQPMAISAIIEYEEISGEKSGAKSRKGWLERTFGANKSSSSNDTINDLIDFMTRIWKSLRTYYVEETISRQILFELVRIIGYTAFNELMMRKNFATYKRGIQLQFNEDKLRSWITNHNIGEATAYLEPLFQATKILFLPKYSATDVETIFEVGNTMTAGQIRRLLSLYYATDYEEPVSQELLREIGKRTIDDPDDAVLLNISAVELIKPRPRAVEVLETWIPPWLEGNVPNLQRVLIEVDSLYVDQEENGLPVEDGGAYAPEDVGDEEASEP